MKFEDALVEHIASVLPDLIPRKTLFHSHMPADVKSGVLVMARVPVPIDLYSGMRKGSFQIVCRDLKIVLAHDLATSVMKAIASEGVIVGGVDFKYIKPQHEPLVFPRTEGAQFEAAVNYLFAAHWE